MNSSSTRGGRGGRGGGGNTGVTQQQSLDTYAGRASSIQMDANTPITVPQGLNVSRAGRGRGTTTNFHSSRTETHHRQDPIPSTEFVEDTGIRSSSHAPPRGGHRYQHYQGLSSGINTSTPYTAQATQTQTPILPPPVNLAAPQPPSLQEYHQQTMHPVPQSIPYQQPGQPLMRAAEGVVKQEAVESQVQGTSSYIHPYQDIGTKLSALALKLSVVFAEFATEIGNNENLDNQGSA